MSFINKSIRPLCSLARSTHNQCHRTPRVTCLRDDVSPHCGLSVQTPPPQLHQTCQLRSLSGFATPKYSSSIFNTVCMQNTYGVSRTVHTQSEADKQFIEFLSSEISSEQQELGKLPTVTGFEVETTGPHVKFSRKHNGEIITVQFDVNGSVDSFGEAEDAVELTDGDSSETPEMISSPDFTVTLKKDGASSNLSLKCQLVDPNMNKDVPEDEADNFEIVELAMVDGKWDDNTYYVNADLLDGNMYDMLMMMLEERGINNTTFCEELVRFSTSHEHNKYVSMLESLYEYASK